MSPSVRAQLELVLEPDPRDRWWSYVDFWLGLHKPEHLAKCPYPTFFSYIQIMSRWMDGTFPIPMSPVCADSGGFTIVGKLGYYPWTRQTYADNMMIFHERTGGRLAWCAAMDYMCEPHMIAKTGLSKRDHQKMSIESVVELRRIRPELHWSTVLQGEHPDEYLYCAELYAAAGIDLRREPIVGLGSVCRRQGTRAIKAVVDALRPLGLRLHGLGVKADGFDIVGEDFWSADSQAGSQHARRRLPMEHHRQHIGLDQVVETRHIRSTRPILGTFSVRSLRDMSLSALRIRELNGFIAVPVRWLGRCGWVIWVPGSEETWFSTHRNCANCLEYSLDWRSLIVMPRIEKARTRVGMGSRVQVSA